MMHGDGGRHCAEWDEEMLKNALETEYYFRNKVSVVYMYFKRKCRTKQTTLSSDK